MSSRRQRLQHEHAHARQQRAVDLERRILRRRADQRDRARFDVRQKRVLLRLVEAMDLVGEQNRSASEPPAPLRFGDDLAHARHAFGHRGERNELAIGVLRDHARDRRLAGAGRAPEHHRRRRCPSRSPRAAVCPARADAAAPRTRRACADACAPRAAAAASARTATPFRARCRLRPRPFSSISHRARS